MLLYFAIKTIASLTCRLVLNFHCVHLTDRPMGKTNAVLSQRSHFVNCQGHAPCVDILLWQVGENIANILQTYGNTCSEQTNKKSRDKNTNKNTHQTCAYLLFEKIKSNSSRSPQEQTYHPLRLATSYLVVGRW